MENIKGWTIDLKALYGACWGDRKKFGLIEDLYESADGSVAALLYGISEIGVSKSVGSLAVLRHKEKPELLFDLPGMRWWYLYDNTVQFGGNELLYLHRFTGGRAYGVKLCVLDLAAGMFARIDRLQDNSYRVRPAGGSKYEFARYASDGEPPAVIDLKTLSWRPLPHSWFDRLLFRLV